MSRTCITSPEGLPMTNLPFPFPTLSADVACRGRRLASRSPTSKGRWMSGLPCLDPRPGGSSRRSPRQGGSRAGFHAPPRGRHDPEVGRAHEAGLGRH